jgi:hypothetical protein
VNGSCKPIDVEPLAEGEPCHVTGAVCGEGLECFRSGTDPVERCTKAKCGASPCDFKTSFCSVTEDGGQQCVAYRNLGESCSANQQCNPDTGYCKATTISEGTCTVFPKVGEACGGDSNYVACAPDVTCVITDKTNRSGVCAVPAGRGAACSDSQPCIRVLACRKGTCEPPDPTCPADAGL